MYVCLVCHTEPDIWDGGLRSIDTVLPRFLQTMEAVRDRGGRAPRVAWCLTGQVMRRRPEVGVHSHYPAGDGSMEHNQALNQAHLADFHRWLPALCDLARRTGFHPRTHATWMFAYRNDMTRTLAESGIDIDGSICFGTTHSLPGGFLLADSRGRQSGKPYRLSEADHNVAGGSRVVELPVSGGLEDYWEPDATGRPSFFSPTATDDDRDRQLRLFQARLDDLAPDEADIFHIHFHLYPLLGPGGLRTGSLQRARGLLEAMAGDGRVRFATPAEAVDAWSSRSVGARGRNGERPARV
jgi:hypothetical protein